jgi:UDP-N-acetylmuramate dehydrogenase
VLPDADRAAGPSSLLADHTTIRLGGPATRFERFDDAADLVACVRASDDAQTPVLVLGGGSNLVVADAGFDGTVAGVATRGVEIEAREAGVLLRVAAGECWDDVVLAALASGLAGLECLSGIPGLAGATPLQNVGAYGSEISDHVVSVHAFDRVERRDVVLDPAHCGFGYRTSALKVSGRYVVVRVELRLVESPLSAPIRYEQLADALGVRLGERVPAADVRAAVLALRAAKGMLLDAHDPDSVSAGSFFTNPVLPAAVVPQGAPRWPFGDGLTKTSAAWLIEHAGFTRGFGQGRVGLSTKHTLAVVNRGGATTAEVVEFARLIRDGVRARFDIELDVEPMLIGVAL